MRSHDIFPLSKLLIRIISSTYWVEFYIWLVILVFYFENPTLKGSVFLLQPGVMKDNWEQARAQWVSQPFTQCPLCPRTRPHPHHWPRPRAKLQSGSRRGLTFKLPGSGTKQTFEKLIFVILFWRRGSNLSLLLDVSTLGAESMCSVTTPKEVWLQLLHTSSRPLTHALLQEACRDTKTLNSEYQVTT